MSTVRVYVVVADGHETIGDPRLAVAAAVHLNAPAAVADEAGAHAAAAKDAVGGLWVN